MSLRSELKRQLEGLRHEYVKADAEVAATMRLTGAMLVEQKELWPNENPVQRSQRLIDMGILSEGEVDRAMARSLTASTLYPDSGPAQAAVGVRVARVIRLLWCAFPELYSIPEGGGGSRRVQILRAAVVQGLVSEEDLLLFLEVMGGDFREPTAVLSGSIEKGLGRRLARRIVNRCDR
jgi:hypothetical protein